MIFFLENIEKGLVFELQLWTTVFPPKDGQYPSKAFPSYDAHKSSTTEVHSHFLSHMVSLLQPDKDELRQRTCNECRQSWLFLSLSLSQPIPVPK